MRKAYITHEDPIWRADENMIFQVEVSSSEEETVYEQFWSREKGDGLYEVTVIPFIAYNIALGDIVRISETYKYLGVVQPSGRFVYRIYVLKPRFRKSILKELETHGYLYETLGKKLIAVDAPDEQKAADLRAYVEELAVGGFAEFETGRQDEEHSNR